MSKPALAKRIRRKFGDGRYDMRIYVDGSMHVRVDHPSNDPEIEFAMAGRVYRVARETYLRLGLGEPVMGPVRWRDDPEPSP